MKLSKIILYDEPSVPEIHLKNLGEFLKKTFPVEVELRENILKYSKENTSQQIAGCKIFNMRKDFEKHVPTAEEIAFEKLNVENSSTTENIIMYDGFQLQRVFADLIPDYENARNIFHIFFTNKLTCTYDYNDYRYHGRALIGANPAIISTTGIIEAPAKPREYYYELMTNFTRGVNVNFVKEKFRGTYLEYHDPRLSKIIEGYLLQTIFYYETGEPFCDNKDCKLLNAHWQKDLIYSQLESGKLCDKHQSVLEKMTTK